MYQSFEAVIKNGRIQPIEKKIKLKNEARILVTVMPEKEEDSPDNWKKLKRWLTQQRKAKKYTSYSSIETAKAHLQRLTNKS